MARMMPRSERKMRKVIGKVGEGILGIMEAEEIVKSPHKYAVKKFAEEMVKVDKVKKRRGVYRRREQIYNPKTGRFYVRDAKTKRIIYGGKRTPYKNIRRAKSRRGKR